MVVRVLFDEQGLVEAGQGLLHVSRLPVQIAKGNQLNPFVAHPPRRTGPREQLFMLDDLNLYRRTLRAGRCARKKSKGEARNRSNSLRQNHLSPSTTRGWHLIDWSVSLIAPALPQ